MQLSLTPAEFNPKKLKFSSSIERVGFQKFKELEIEEKYIESNKILLKKKLSNKKK